jgi:endoglucanase Acf2
MIMDQRWVDGSDFIQLVEEILRDLENDSDEDLEFI